MDDEHSDLDATITLKREQRAGIKRPVLHVTMPDGRVTEFRHRAIVIPEDKDDTIFCVLINGLGEIFHTPDGEPVVLSVPAYGVSSVLPDRDRLLDYKKVAKLVGHSTRDVRRMVEDGRLPQPVATGTRSVRFNEGEIRDAIRQLRKK